MKLIGSGIDILDLLLAGSHQVVCRGSNNTALIFTVGKDFVYVSFCTYMHYFLQSKMVDYSRWTLFPKPLRMNQLWQFAPRRWLQLQGTIVLSFIAVYECKRAMSGKIETFNAILFIIDDSSEHINIPDYNNVVYHCTEHMECSVYGDDDGEKSDATYQFFTLVCYTFNYHGNGHMHAKAWCRSLTRRYGWIKARMPIYCKLTTSKWCARYKISSTLRLCIKAWD